MIHKEYIPYWPIVIDLKHFKNFFNDKFGSLESLLILFDDEVCIFLNWAIIKITFAEVVNECNLQKKSFDYRAQVSKILLIAV